MTADSSFHIRVGTSSDVLEDQLKNLAKKEFRTKSLEFTNIQMLMKTPILIAKSAQVGQLSASTSGQSQEWSATTSRPPPSAQSDGGALEVRS